MWLDDGVEFFGLGLFAYFGLIFELRSNPLRYGSLLTLWLGWDDGVFWAWLGWRSFLGLAGMTEFFGLGWDDGVFRLGWDDD